ncbi:alternative ribosome rescue aminoacyl-tRNA hydrolase ArfB [Hyphomonas sp. FCG-A18]|uniref:alternative ribosome rescue aminoacyl-tRNA hydrolase ArfB n=1 Tax=Hyphomonas sp. FCG-A18 TaxID=3080019 RepID=UPI002B2BBA49|nr:alternative ribosome rescue aminoacyl-tRNA hydrolase ArfB [Hyphomonas sp. FCG-A18]
MQSGAIKVTDELSIPEWELVEQFVRASGPGGQNVNKVSTAVQLRWNVEASALPAAVKARFCRRFGSRLTKDGDIIIEAKDHRSQALNREAARKRLAEMVRGVAKPPKRRIATKPTKGAVRRRLKAKKVRSEVKSLRGKVQSDD